MTYQDAQARLLAYVQDRIHNGEVTERRLARQIGISQPHVHNVLKGVRSLSPEIFDSLLAQFQLSLLDLAPIEDLQDSLRRRHALEQAADVAFLAGLVGPGNGWITVIDRKHHFPLPFPSTTSPPGLVMAHLTNDPAMAATLAGADIALLDTSEPQRADLVPDGVYVVSRGHEAVLRYIRPGWRKYYLPTDANLDQPVAWYNIRVSKQELFEMIKARVRWLGRERNRSLPMRQRGRFLYDAISM
ncbi:MAG TPA: hypothetical protein VKX49_24650 [Bryobacteraceae bacterium]|nr:hypothetical protein [Bryobacteraceae bacterium]